MDIQLEKYKIMEWLINLKDESIIKEIKKIKKSWTSNSDWSDEITDNEKLFIEAGLKDIAQGNTISHDEVMKKIKSSYGL